MEPDYHQKRARMNPKVKERWIREQALVRKKIVHHDQFKWTLETLDLIGAVDVSFTGKFPNGACVGLAVYSLKNKKIVYSDLMYVQLREEYIPGFLAFRELPPTLQLFKKLQFLEPDLMPQVVLVDGNGVLHKYECGYACHLGVILDIPTIGCAKTFFDVDGLHQQGVEDHLKETLKKHGETARLVGKSGKEWCTAIVTDEKQAKHNFISVGHRVSLETATAVVKMVTWRDGPEPIIWVDRNSRKMARKMQEKDLDKAPSFDMVFLAE